jgi:hypothetical protein
MGGTGMSEISFLREQLRKGHSDDPWHQIALLRKALRSPLS